MPTNPIRTPDQRLRVFISSTLTELQPERAAVRKAVKTLNLAPVMFELGARAHPPRSLYRSYLEQSDIFIGIYWQSYGWIAPDEGISGLEDEYRLSGKLPSLIYIKTPATDREERLTELLKRIRASDRVSYKSFRDAAELRKLVTNDLSTLLADRFDLTRAAYGEEGGPGPGAGARAIPSPYTPIIGRVTDRDVVVGMLRSAGTRMVTLAGPGGIGKSRLAIEVASKMAAAGSEVAFVLLDSVSSTDDVLPRIARAVGVRDTGESAVEATLVAALEGRDVLLVLDNMEQILDSTDVVVRLITALPTLTVLVTSRSPLRVRAERVYLVGPLVPPEPGANLAAIGDNACVALFVERANGISPGFRLTDSDATTVAAICRALDGVPLAIELAAARMRSLAPAEILERLDSALLLLVDGARDLPARQQTIRATIEWSANLLDDNARAALGALAIFDGPFTRASAEAVLDSLPAAGAAAALDLLVDSSLLQRRERRGVPLFVLLAVVQAYAKELAGAEAVRERWVDHYCQLAATASHEMAGSAQIPWVHRLDAEGENLAAVLRFLMDSRRFDDTARMAWSLYLHSWLAGTLGDQRARMSEMLAVSARDSVPLAPWTEAVAQYFAHAIGFWQDPELDVIPGLSRSAVLFEQAGDKRAASLARVSLGLAFLGRKREPDVHAAHETLSRAIDGFATARDEWGEAMALVPMGRLKLALGDPDAALAHFERSLALATSNRERLGIVIAQHHRGWARLAKGEVGAADADFAAGLEASLALGHDEGIAYGLEGRAGAAALRGDVEAAGLMLGAATAVRRRMGMTDPGQLALYSPAIESLPDDEARALLDAAIDRGSGLSPQEVLDAIGY